MLSVLLAGLALAISASGFGNVDLAKTEESANLLCKRFAILPMYCSESGVFLVHPAQHPPMWFLTFSALKFPSLLYVSRPSSNSDDDLRTRGFRLCWPSFASFLLLHPFGRGVDFGAGGGILAHHFDGLLDSVPARRGR